MASLQCRQRRSKAKTGWLVVPDVDRPLASDEPSPHFEEPVDSSPPSTLSFCLSPKHRCSTALWDQKDLAFSHSPNEFDDENGSQSTSPTSPLSTARNTPETKKLTAGKLKSSITRSPKIENLAPLAIGGAIIEKESRGEPLESTLEEEEEDVSEHPSPSSVCSQSATSLCMELESPASSEPSSHQDTSSLHQMQESPPQEPVSPTLSHTQSPSREHSRPLVSPQELRLLSTPSLAPICPTPPLESPTPGTPSFSDTDPICEIPLSQCFSSSHSSDNSSTVSLSPKLSASSSSSSSSLPNSPSWTPSSGSPSREKVFDSSKDAPMLAVDLLFQQQRERNNALMEQVRRLEEQVVSLKSQLSSAFESISVKEVSISEMESQVSNMATAARFWQEEAARLWLHQCTCGKQQADNLEPPIEAPRPLISHCGEDQASPLESPVTNTQVQDFEPEQHRETTSENSDLLHFLEGRAPAQEAEEKNEAAHTAGPECSEAQGESHFALAAEYRQWIDVNSAVDDGHQVYQCELIVEDPLCQPDEELLPAPSTLHPEQPLTLEPADQQHSESARNLSPVRESAFLLASVLEGPSLQGSGIQSILEHTLECEEELQTDEEECEEELQTEEEEYEDEGAEVGLRLLSWVLRPFLRQEVASSA